MHLEPSRITSLDDPRVAEYRNVRDADLRGGGGLSPAGPHGPSNKLFIAESLPVIERLIDSGRYAIKSIFVSDEKWSALRAVRSPRRLPDPHSPDGSSGFAASGGAVYVAPAELLRQITGYRHHGGALAIGYRLSIAQLDPAPIIAAASARERHCLLLCEGITHVDNIGAIFRNAAALGADGIILDAACADPLFRKAIRVSMGEVFNVRWGIAIDFRATLRSLAAQAGTTLIAADTHANAVPIHEFVFPPRCAILLGAERQGIAAASFALAKHIVEIPMARPGSSLNVAVASAIMLHEWQRQNPARDQE